jgi:formate hydrogenlyase transcriptional activator
MLGAERQADRLQLLLELTSQITSNLELQDLLRAISANIRKVMLCDAVAISLPDTEPGKLRLYAFDFPESKGYVSECVVTSRSEEDPARRALDTMKPVVFDTADMPADAREIAVAEGLNRHCFIPLANRGRAFGILGVSRKERSFSEDEVDFLHQASGQIAIAVENALAYREISQLKDKLAQEKLYLEEEIRSEMGFEQIIGQSAALKHVLELVNTVAPSDSTVLLLGETGTGKELIARAIHEHSRRKGRTFVKTNCAAIPTGLLESELFGHERGAFTGAISQKIGRLELADQGTLFLDEVGDIPIEIQPKLLRALQEREFERLGSTHTRKVNIRLVAATNRDLEQMIRDREFRSDLYYRLNVFPIRIPPLRERREDIPPLVSFFVQKYSKQMQKKIEAIPSAVMKGITGWDWPGNIRELENFIERAVLLTRGKSLEAPIGELRRSYVEELKPGVAQQPTEDIARILKETLEGLGGRRRRTDERADERRQKQKEEIIRVLTETGGRVGGTDGAAARIGINRTTLLSRMKRFGIDPHHFA